MAQSIGDMHFKHRSVQDLAWVIQSPPLISGQINNVNWWDNAFFNSEYQHCLPALRQLDRDPTSLLNALASAKSQRLGHYFEALVAYWIGLSPNYVLLLQNFQLRTTGKSGKTLGEIDFLLRENASNKIIHLEVAVKFYLGTATLNDMANWHGPGLQDRLDRKFQHLCNHQTQLTRKYPELIPHPVDESACLMKGRLFYPPNASPETNFTSTSHLSGHWYELPATPDVERQYWHLGKKNWLATISAQNQAQPVSLPHKLDEPVLYAQHDNDAETQRFFLLPENFWLRPQGGK